MLAACAGPSPAAVEKPTDVALETPSAKPAQTAVASAEPIASARGEKPAGVVVAPAVEKSLSPKLQAFLRGCMQQYIDKELSGVAKCFDPAYLKDQSHSPVRYVVLDSLGFFTVSHHVSGPATNDDGLVWRGLELIDVRGVEQRGDHWSFSGRVVAGDIVYELHLSIYGSDATGYMLRGPVG